MNTPKIINCITYEGYVYKVDDIVTLYDSMGFGQYYTGRLISITDLSVVIDASELHKSRVVTIDIDRITEIRLA